MHSHADSAYADVELVLESVRLRVGEHIGAFYRGDDERNAFVIPLIGEALAVSCGVIYVCDRESPETVQKQLIAEGVDVQSAARRGQLQLIAATDAYLAGGVFDPGRMVGYYRRAWEESRRCGYPVLCVIGEMSWSLRECPGTERLLEYEALYAKQFGASPMITLCLYDLERTRGEQIFDLLRVHSRVILNGVEMQNPHQIDPGFFLPRDMYRP
jgi:MEDS: MEthanogen/methylotroph, DcmR Sensory domain